MEVLSAKKLLTDFLDTYKFTDKAVSKNNILSVKNLSVNFAQHEVLKGINLEVQEGEKFQLSGKMELVNQPLPMHSVILLKRVAKFYTEGNRLLLILFLNVRKNWLYYAKSKSDDFAKYCQ